MGEILGKIYCVAEDLFGQNLAEYLWGYNCQTEVYDRHNLFNTFGIIAIVISLVLVVAYYYLPLFLFNHPRSNRWWNWSIILLVSSTINFFIASIWTQNDFLDGKIGDCLMYTRDEVGEIIAHLINRSDCWMFGLSNFIFSILPFIFWTLLFKWGSTNCKNSPR